MPNEPRIIDAERQQHLTESYLLPYLAELEAFFLELRAEVDRQLATTLAPKHGKPYPLGQCLEITVAAQELLKSLDPAMLRSRQARSGHAAYQAFCRAGGSLRQVWGDLRGEFFQNAFQLGSLYLDVSNDTVTPTKPKVELLPFAQARFVAIRDFAHFSQIARQYWQVEVYPNHVLPELAPYLPVIWCYPDGQLMLGAAFAYMVALTLTQRLVPSEQMLARPPMPAAVFKRVQQALAGNREWVLADGPEQGRLQALQACRQLQRKKTGLPKHLLNRVILNGETVNRQLKRAALSSTPAPVMPLLAPVTTSGSIQFMVLDGKKYALAALSAAARQQVQMLEVTERRLQELQRDRAIAQTARDAYLLALQASLPSA
ncbi:hypothetical protein GTP27_17715 [Pseudoduganella sp. CY13W]|uniref:Uncharacterized protein n=1 Tax=Duganella qianjiadongensis TaxID=2692176 RepID=A0ABW9VNL8_9BURK|nr:hypothetical protein [Duganella qianjiadongensis]